MCTMPKFTHCSFRSLSQNKRINIKVLFIQRRLQAIKIQSRLVDERKTKQKQQLYLTEHPSSPFQSNIKIVMPVFSRFASRIANGTYPCSSNRY